MDDAAKALSQVDQALLDLQRIRQLADEYVSRGQPIPAQLDADLAEIEQQLAALLARKPTVH